MRTINIRFCNGLSFNEGVRDILGDLVSEFRFVDGASPEFVVFGPYGADIPRRESGVVTIGYFCECMRPDLSICDWAFGVPYEEEIADPRYKRIDWHGFAPGRLVKAPSDVDRLLDGKTRFCNFLYANPVPYRERFFRELSKYKRVDAPGRSMNNMAPIDIAGGPDMWETKRRFLAGYKFTIAFENYSYPGYHSEKILDPMLAGSLPIYLGNPRIADHFNPRSFINARDYTGSLLPSAAGLLEAKCQRILPPVTGGNTLPVRGARKLVYLGRDLKMRLQCWNYSDLVDLIVSIDRDDALYARYMAEPWYYGNQPATNASALERWRTIFNSPASH